jgi:hypothetical protein
MAEQDARISGDHAAGLDGQAAFGGVDAGYGGLGEFFERYSYAVFLVYAACALHIV